MQSYPYNHFAQIYIKAMITKHARQIQQQVSALVWVSFTKSFISFTIITLCCLFSVIRQHRCEWWCLPHQHHNIESNDVEAGDIEAGDIEAHDVQAHDVQAHNFDAYDFDAYDVDAHNVQAHDVKACDVQAHENNRMHLSQWYAWYQMCWIEGLW